MQPVLPSSLCRKHSSIDALTLDFQPSSSQNSMSDSGNSGRHSTARSQSSETDVVLSEAASRIVLVESLPNLFQRKRASADDKARQNKRTVTGRTRAVGLEGDSLKASETLECQTQKSASLSASQEPALKNSPLWCREFIKGPSCL